MERPPLPPRPNEETIREWKNRILNTECKEQEEEIDEVCIPSAEPKVNILDKNQKAFVVYVIQTVTKSKETWIVDKRFSELFEFDKTLAKVLRKSKPKFPTRFSSKNKMSRYLIESRRSHLEKYLSQVVEIDDQKVQSMLVNFLKSPYSDKRRLSRSYSTGWKSLPIDDPTSLKARALRREVFSGRLKFMNAPPTLNSKAQSTLCVELGKLVAQQQSTVDYFAAKMLRIYPATLISNDDDGDDYSKPELGILRDNKLRSYLHKLFTKEQPHGAEHLLTRVHRFLAQISWKTIHDNKESTLLHESEGNTEEFQFEIIYRLFEVATICRHPEFGDRLLTCARFLCAEKDQIVLDKLKHLREKFQVIPPSLFDACINPSLNVHSVDECLPLNFAWGWESSVAILQLLNSKEHSPSAKAEIMLDCISDIQRGLTSATCSKELILGADDFIPVFFYVIASANILTPYATLKYLSAIASEALMDSQVKYWLTVFESGLHFISTL